MTRVREAAAARSLTHGSLLPCICSTGTGTGAARERSSWRPDRRPVLRPASNGVVRR